MVPVFVTEFHGDRTLCPAKGSIHPSIGGNDSIFLTAIVSALGTGLRPFWTGVILKDHNARGGWIARVGSWFPDREFFMRSEGQVRFITISSRVQIAAASLAAFALLAWGGSMGAMTWSQYRASADRASLLEREAKVSTSEERLAAYRDDIDAVADDLRQRQDFLDGVLDVLPEDLKVESAVSDSTGEAADTVSKVSLAVPEAAALARIEARQLAFVEGMTRYADWRAERAAKGLRELGIDPSSALRTARSEAMGGPYEPVAREIDPRFERLGLSLARMTALERGLEGVPQVNPASRGAISSGFGYRRDPFNRSAAMHRGLDFKAPTGTPISATSTGRVTYVGWKSGYGKTVEIKHANGVMTRYAHMSRFDAKVGQKVSAGETIGAIGSTGRSTGPHLHFEVHVNGRAVNPRPFLERAPNVLKEIRQLPELARR